MQSSFQLPVVFGSRMAMLKECYKPKGTKKQNHNDPNESLKTRYIFNILFERFLHASTKNGWGNRCWQSDKLDIFLLKYTVYLYPPNITNIYGL